MSLLFRFHGKAFDKANAARLLLNGEEPSADEVVRIIRRQGLKAKIIPSSPERLPLVHLPALARGKVGGYFILAKAVDGKVLIQRPNQSPKSLSFSELAEIWDKNLGPVDKVDSQRARTVIQHCFWGGRVGTRRSIERAMGVDWGTVAIRTRPQVETGAG